MLKIIHILTLVKKVNDKDPKCKAGDHVRNSNQKNIFAKGYILNWSEEVCMIKKVKSTVPQTYVIKDLNVEEVVETFYEKNCKKQISKNLQQKK